MSKTIFKNRARIVFKQQIFKVSAKQIVMSSSSESTTSTIRPDHYTKKEEEKKEEEEEECGLCYGRGVVVCRDCVGTGKFDVDLCDMCSAYTSPWKLTPKGYMACRMCRGTRKYSTRCQLCFGGLIQCICARRKAYLIQKEKKRKKDDDGGEGPSGHRDKSTKDVLRRLKNLAIK